MIEQSHLEIPVNERCAFCDYLSSIRPYTVLYEDETVAALVTREQRGVGHVLVLPVRHIQSILEINEKESTKLMILMRNIANAIDKTYHRPGISIWQNNGVPTGQAIAHLHFHLAGTLDNGATERGDVPEISVTDTDLIALQLKEHLLNDGLLT